MNILHIISGGEVGGSKNHLLSLVKTMVEKNNKSIIICFIEGQLYKEALQMGLDVRLVRQNRRFDLSIVSRIRRICMAESINIVNCHGGRANFVGFFLKRTYAARYATTIHSDYRDDYRGNIYKTLIYSNLNRAVLKAFDNYITVSDSFKEMLVERGFRSGKIFVVYNGIDFNRQKIECTREEMIKKYSLPNSAHFVSMVARFHPVKGHRVFLEACKLVLESFRDACFILVGDGSVKDEMVEYVGELGIEGKVSFVGFQKPDEFLCISDFTVMASFTESFPLSILESALYKKAVVSTEVGGISKLIEDGKNGYLVQPGDSIGIAEGMIKLLKNPELCRVMGSELHLKAKESYSVENMVKTYENIYESMLNKEGSND